MKRFFSFLTVMALLLLCACANNPQPTEPPATDAPTDAATPTDTAAPTDDSSETTEAPTEASEPMTETVYSNARIYRNDAGEVWVQVIVEVRNVSDETLCCRDTTVNVEANGKTLVQLKSVPAYPQIIEPKESAYYYEATLVDTDYDGEVTAVLERNESVATVPCVNYRVEGELFDSVYGGVKLTGEVKNTSDSTGDLVCVGAVLLDKYGTPLGLVFDYLAEPLKPTETVEYAFENDTLPEDVNLSTVTDIVPFAYPLQAQ